MGERTIVLNVIDFMRAYVKAVPNATIEEAQEWAEEQVEAVSDGADEFYRPEDRIELTEEGMAARLSELEAR